MISVMALARARTALEGLVRPAAFRRAADDAERAWSAVRRKLTLSRDMASDKRRTRLAKNILGANLREPVRYLEIGSFEGGSLAFVHALLKGQVRATAIDPFEAYEEMPTADMSSIEARFRTNVQAIGADVRVLRGQSIAHLPPLVADAESFELIYVDGSHAAFDVLSDSVLCWRLLTPGGLMIFDDYRWGGCKEAIDAFVSTVSLEVDVIDAAGQVFLRRHHLKA